MSAFKIIKTNDMRKHRFYYDYLVRNGIPIAPETKNIANLRENINNSIYLYFNNNDKRNDFIARMELACKYELIPLSEFAWLRKQDKACIFAWAYILNLTNKQVEMSGPTQIYRQRPYKKLGLSLNPENTKERMLNILAFFDAKEINREVKITLLRNIRTAWGIIYNLPDPFPWLDKRNEAQCKWVWKYLGDKIPNYNINPISSSEVYLAIYALFHIWDEYGDLKDTLAHMLYKAWCQKESRKKTVKKDNTQIIKINKSDEIYLKLQLLAEHEKKDIISIINDLVNQAYDKLERSN